MIAPSEGEIFIDGIDAVKDPNERQTKSKYYYWR